jgi:hypothetical protein
MACGVGGATAVTLALAVPATGCTTHQCDLSTVELGGGSAPLGTVTPLPDGEIKWESNPMEGPWLDFPGERTYVLHYAQAFATAPEPFCQVSSDLTNGQNNFVSCGGNLAIFMDATTTGVTVLNPTCAEVGLRVFVQGFPAASSTDAGDDTGLEAAD